MWKFHTNRTKNEKVIAYTICVLRPYRLQSYLSEPLPTRERLGGGVMVYVLFFLTMLANDIPTTFLTCNWLCEENGCGSRQHLSITPAFTGVGYVLCSPPQSAELALRSDISKLDCTGLKIDPFRNCWACIAVFGLIL